VLRVDGIERCQRSPDLDLERLAIIRLRWLAVACLLREMMMII